MKKIKTRQRHGLWNHKHYRMWRNMVSRCHKESHKDYANYGGRGIEVYIEWRDTPSSFIKYIKDNLSDCPEGFSLDRIHNDKGYEPENIKWSSKMQQANNTRTNKTLSFNGLTMSQAEWSRKTGISPMTISNRIKSNWSTEDVLTKPVKACRAV